jgi:hypothetical protein
MKNRQFELLRHMARQYHRNKRGHQFEQGILVRHDYGEFDANDLSWWDDVQFIFGGLRVTVAWQHPRHVYQGMIKDAAMKATHHLYEKIDGDLFDGAEKSYKKIGRSRKKVQSYTPIHRPGEQEWLDAVRAEKARLNMEAEFSVVPSVTVKTLAWCRFVEMVAPVEIRNSAELRTLADLARRILKGEITLEREFPGYIYGKTNWIDEGLTEQSPYLVSHRIAGT